MSILVAERELYQSCRILFGSDIEIGGDFLNYLRPAGLKKAYRLKALQTHPDLAVANQARGGNVSLAEFLSVQQAYENLRCFLDRRDLSGGRYSTVRQECAHGFTPRPPWRGSTEHCRQQAKPHPEQPGSRNWESGGGRDNLYTRLYRGAVPPIRMRLGNFMYYSGMIDWMTIVKVLIWQRSQRPRLGELARRFGWLTDEEIRQVLANRQLMEKFGASAVRRQNLTEKQLKVIVGYQNILQKKFGAYFLEQRLITPAELATLVRRHREHNASCAGPRSV